MKRFFILISILFVFIFSTYADVKLNEQTVVIFSTVENGKKILGQRDDFVVNMSPFDRAARMKTDKVVSEKEYLEEKIKNPYTTDVKYFFKAIINILFRNKRSA